MTNDIVSRVAYLCAQASHSIIKSMSSRSVYKIIITVLTFWLIDFLLHYTGVGETNFYYTSKFGNAVLFAIIWFFILAKKGYWKKLIYSFIFGTYISFYYLIASYSGFVQFFFGVYARYTPPPFVIFGLYLPAFFWWILHSLAFFLGLFLADMFIQEKTVS